MNQFNRLQKWHEKITINSKLLRLVYLPNLDIYNIFLDSEIIF